MFTLKKFLLITAAAAVVGIGAALVWTHYQAGNINEAAAQSVNTEAPDITVTAMDGTGPCMQEMPEMNKIYPDYKDKIEFFAVSIDDSRSDYEKYAGESGFAYPMYWGDKNAIVKAYGLQGIPASYIVDKYGTITKSHIGGMKEKELRAFLDSGL